MSFPKDVIWKNKTLLESLGIGDRLKVVNRKKRFAGQYFDLGEVLEIVSKNERKNYNNGISVIIGLKLKDPGETVPEPKDAIPTIQIIESELAKKLSNFEIIKKRPCQ